MAPHGWKWKVRPKTAMLKMHRHRSGQRPKTWSPALNTVMPETENLEPALNTMVPPADSGNADRDGADVQQPTAIAQRLASNPACTTEQGSGHVNPEPTPISMF
eukprot:135181-Chlamydomonas_euryale.AAC.3